MMLCELRAIRANRCHGSAEFEPTNHLRFSWKENQNCATMFTGVRTKWETKLETKAFLMETSTLGDIYIVFGLDFSQEEAILCPQISHSNNIVSLLSKLSMVMLVMNVAFETAESNRT
jgi:hypothetical protein